MARPKKENDGTLYTCPDCAELGLPDLPEDAFYHNRYRMLYCKKHHNKRNAERQAARQDPTSPAYDSVFHAAQKERRWDYAWRKLQPNSPDYDPELHERQKLAKKKSYRKRADTQGVIPLPVDPVERAAARRRLLAEMRNARKHKAR